MSWYDDLIAGRNPYGEIGFGVANELLNYGRAPTGTAPTSRLASLGAGMEYRPWAETPADQYRLTGSGDFDPTTGVFTRDGKPMIQVDPSMASAVVDPSRVTYDPRIGAMTDPENYKPSESWVDKFMGNAIRGVAIGGPLAMMSGMVPGVEGVFGNGGLLGGGADAASATPAAGAAPAAGGALDSYMAGAAGAGTAGTSGGFMSGLLNAALANPLQAAGLLYSASGMLGGGNNSGSQPSGGSSNIGLLNPQAFQRPQYKPNAHTLAQLNQLYGGRYGG